LRCSGSHEFDGWFKDSASFDAQARAGLLGCPICASPDVERALMAPNVRTRAAVRPRQEAVTAPEARSPEARSPEALSDVAGAAQVEHSQGDQSQGGETPGEQLVLPPMPDQMRAMLQRMRATVEKHCDYVGTDFAESARQMANGEVAPRPIYGEATPEQEASLEDDGIAFARIPWVPRANG
jgi:hypothetical protein